MADGVQGQGERTWRIVDMENLTDVGEGREDLGLMMSMFWEV